MVPLNIIEDRVFLIDAFPSPTQDCRMALALVFLRSISYLQNESHDVTYSCGLASTPNKYTH